MSLCHNRTQITLKSKQEFPGLVNVTFFSVYFPLLSRSVAKCRGSWVVGKGRGSWVWVWVNVAGKKKKNSKKKN